VDTPSAPSSPHANPQSLLPHSYFTCQSRVNSGVSPTQPLSVPVAVSAAPEAFAGLGTPTPQHHIRQPQPHTRQLPQPSSSQDTQPLDSEPEESVPLRETRLFRQLVSMSDEDFERFRCNCAQDQFMIVSLASGRRMKTKQQQNQHSSQVSPVSPLSADAIVVGGVPYLPKSPCPDSACGGELVKQSSRNGYAFFGCSNYRAGCRVTVHRASGSHAASVKGVQLQHSQQLSEQNTPQMQLAPSTSQSTALSTTQILPPQNVAPPTNSQTSPVDLSEYSAARCVRADGLPSTHHYSSKGCHTYQAKKCWRWVCKSSSKTSKNDKSLLLQPCKNSLYVLMDEKLLQAATEKVTVRNCEQFYVKPYVVFSGGEPHNHEVQKEVSLDYQTVPEHLETPIQELFAAGKREAGVILETLHAKGLHVTKKNVEAVLARVTDRARDQTVVVENHPGVDTVFLKTNHLPMLGVVVSFDELWESIPNIRDIHHIFVDGTHDMLSTAGTQVVTVQGLLPSGEVVPLAYLLVNSASQSAYSQLGLFLYGKGLRPRYVHVDFEDNFYKAFTAHFDFATIVQCYFHLQQAVLKNFRKYFPQTNEAAQRAKYKTVHQFTNLLASSTSIDQFKITLSKFQQEVSGYKCRALHSFFHDYFLPTWVCGKYGIRSWSMINEQSKEVRAIRTNNFAELWNRHLKEITFERKLHVSLVEVVDRLFNTLRAAKTRVDMWTKDVARFAPKSAVTQKRAVQSAAATPNDITATATTITLDLADDMLNLNTRRDDTALEQHAPFVVPGVVDEQPVPFVVPGTFLHNLITALGLEVVENAGIGLCQHMALADTMQGGVDFVDVRSAIIDGLRTNTELRTYILTTEAFHVFADELDEYINQLEHSNEWGNDLTLTAFAWIFERDVLVLHADPRTTPNFFRLHEMRGIPSPLPPITIGYNGHHYVGTRFAQTAVDEASELDELVELGDHRQQLRVETIQRVAFLDTGNSFASRVVVGSGKDRVGEHLTSTESRGQRKHKALSVPNTRHQLQKAKALNDKIHHDHDQIRHTLDSIRSKYLAQQGLGDGGDSDRGDGGEGGGGAAGVHGAGSGRGSGEGGDGGEGGSGHVGSGDMFSNTFEFFANSDDDEFIQPPSNLPMIQRKRTPTTTPPLHATRAVQPTQPIAAHVSAPHAATATMSMTQLAATTNDRSATAQLESSPTQLRTQPSPPQQLNTVSATLPQRAATSPQRAATSPQPAANDHSAAQPDSIPAQPQRSNAAPSTTQPQLAATQAPPTNDRAPAPPATERQEIAAAGLFCICLFVTRDSLRALVCWYGCRRRQGVFVVCITCKTTAHAGCWESKPDKSQQTGQRPYMCRNCKKWTKK
jgi:hypothetical protein